MKDIYDEAKETTKECGSLDYNCLKQNVLQFATEKTLGINQSEEFNFGSVYDPNWTWNWMYVSALVRHYSRVQEEDWKINDIGSFFIKILNSANGNNGIKWNWDISCDSIREDVLTKVHEIFGNFNTEINLLEMAYLYTLDDFTTYFYFE